MECCEICGRYKAELHHIVFRSQAPYMANIKINFKYLCDADHRGDKGPHRNKEKDLKYKNELQKKLFQLFDRDYYSEREIKELLGTTISEARKITKKLKVYKEGYKRFEIVCRLMGGRFYSE